MNTPGTDRGNATAPRSCTTRMLALIATASIGILFEFDTVCASESTADVFSATDTKPASSNAQTVGDSPANALALKPAAAPANAASDPMKDMDMGTSPPPSPPAPAPPMPGMDMSTPSVAAPPMGKMGTGSMQGGKAPANARDPDAYAEGYAYTDMRGMEQVDHIHVTKVLVDELEFLSGNEGHGVNWTAEGSYGGDQDKLWVRTQGQKIPGEILDPTTGAEALWWHATSPFWGTQLGLRQDIGSGAHTYLAFGIQGLAPRWFELQATGYVGSDGRLSARFKASYDMRFTNRLILVPSVEANAYSKADVARGTGAGLGNIETGLRLRYEVQRKFAPYIGYVWERSFAGTADLRRAEHSPVNERRFVAGFRMWL
jgi:copper resistance protein B